MQLPIHDNVRRLLASGDVDGATTITLQRYGPAVLRYLRSLLRDDLAAAEAYSYFEEHLWLGLATFRADSSLRTWVYRVARNAALDFRKQAWRRRKERLTTRTADALVDDRTCAPDVVPERRDQLERLRPYLTEPEQTLLILRVDHELPWADIARILARDGRHLDPTTLMKRFDRLTARLQRMARQHGLLP